MNSIALTVMINQLPKLFGFSIDALAAILLLKPYQAHFDATASVKVLGPLPQRLPSFALLIINFGQLDEVVIGEYAVAMAAFPDTSVLSRTYAAKTLMPVDPKSGNDRLGRCESRRRSCNT